MYLLLKINSLLPLENIAESAPLCHSSITRRGLKSEIWRSDEARKREIEARKMDVRHPSSLILNILGSLSLTESQSVYINIGMLYIRSYILSVCSKTVRRRRV